MQYVPSLFLFFREETMLIISSGVVGDAPCYGQKLTESSGKLQVTFEFPRERKNWHKNQLSHSKDK